MASITPVAREAEQRILEALVAMPHLRGIDVGFNEALGQRVLTIRVGDERLSVVFVPGGVDASDEADLPGSPVPPYPCPTCSEAQYLGLENADDTVWRCEKCNCLFGHVSYETSLRYVLDQWHGGGRPKCPTPYSFTWVNSDGLKSRRHGWFDAATRTVIQTG